MLTCILSLTPIWAVENATAPVTLDGRRLFEVSQLEAFDAQPRAEYASRILNQVVQSDEPVTVNVVEINELPVIQVNGINLLTVTRRDTPPGITQEQQAERWRDRITIVVQQAQQQRRPNYLRNALFRSVGCVLLAIALNGILGWIWQHLLSRLIPQGRATPGTGTPSQRIALLLQLALATIKGGIWLGTVLYVSNQFPQTRVWSQKTIDVILFSLVAPIITLGGNSYSIIQIIFLIALFFGLVFVANSAKTVLRSRILYVTGMSRGAQETIAVIVNYTLIFIGTVILLQLWGLDLTSLTIFAGVLGVGIGLGLQGIAKEFVSGLVIIFERPIQVGDFVNVGDYMGIVERISVRSTEIRTLDQLSVLVPNSRFLEKEVVNWNHNNLVSRLRLPIHVAYGSNLDTVREALIDSAKDHPDVVSQPEPNVLFIGYGNYALEFELLVWIAEPRKHPRIKSDLYFRMDKILRDRGIRIPLPQQDLNLRSGSLPLEFSPQMEASLKNWLKNQVNGLNQDNHFKTDAEREKKGKQD